MSHYFTNDFQSDEILTVTWSVGGRGFSLKTGPWMFSYKNFDEGSVFMLEEYFKWVMNNEYWIVSNEKWVVLDLCAGYGLVASCIKSFYPSCSVKAVEINERACDFARQNLSIYGGSSDDVICADALERLESQKNTFDTILVNPPFSAWKQFCFSLLEKSQQSLKKWGVIFVVVPTKKWAKSYFSKLKDVYGEAIQIEIKKGYRLYSAVNK